MKYLSIATLLIATSAYAGELSDSTFEWLKTAKVYPLVINSAKPDDSAGFEIFRMEPGACLRGPLVFHQADGKEQFRLGDGIEYPTGCGKQ